MKTLKELQEEQIHFGARKRVNPPYHRPLGSRPTKPDEPVKPKVAEEIEQVDELKLFATTQELKKREFEARKAKLLAKAKADRTSTPTKNWDNGSYDTTTKRGATQREEVEPLEELSDKTMTSYQMKAFAEKTPKKIRQDGVERANVKIDKRADAKMKEYHISKMEEQIDGKYFDETGKNPTAKFKSAGEHKKLATQGMLKMLATVGKAKYVSHTDVEVPGTVIKPVKEEAEQIDELSKDTLKNYITKVPGSVASHARKVGLRIGDGDNSTSIHDKKIHNRIVGNVKAVSRVTKEEIEPIEELSKRTLSNYISKSSKSAVQSSADTRQKALDLSVPHEDVMKTAKKTGNRLGGIDSAVKRLVKKEETMISFKDYLKQDNTEYEVISEETEVAEEFIGLNDFEHKLKAHRSSGHVVHHDYDHSKQKASIRHVDKEGEVRQYNYHSKGTTVQRLAPLENKETTNDAGKTVTKHDAPGYEKRGRGRPAGKYNGTYKARASKE